MKRIRIALVGDFDEKIHTLVALKESIEHARPYLSFNLETVWVGTETLENVLAGNMHYDGIWIVPGSPYRNELGVYDIIMRARTQNIPILGSCGGFQYMILEYARNVLKIEGATHEETDTGAAANPVIYKLSCSLKGQQEQVQIRDRSSWLYTVLHADIVTGKYFCSYGVNPMYAEQLNQYPLTFTAFSASGEVRAFEMKGHRFFNGTLFQPALDSSYEHPNPLILSFLSHCET